MSAHGQDDAGPWIHPTAEIDEPCEVGIGTRIWHFSHVLSGARIGARCTVGQGVMIGRGVVIGDNCKIQNNVSVYEGVTLEDGVFCGPSCVFTNVINPRTAIDRKHRFQPTHVGRGATIGANATIICGVDIGSFSFVGAGATVSRSVPDHGLVLGVPARLVGYVCECAERLPDGAWRSATCAACGLHFEREGPRVFRV